jgi:outer membrane protein TolC
MQMKTTRAWFTLIKTFVFSPLILVLSSSQSIAASMSLESYLSQVLGDSAAVKSSRSQIEGAALTAKEGGLPTMARLTLQGSFTDDQRQFPNPFQTAMRARALGLGFEKQFDFGLASKISYNLNSLNFGPQPVDRRFLLDYLGAQTQIDLTQSLWRNAFGKETRASAELAEAGSKAAEYAEKFKLKQTLAQAENAYNRLAIAFESVNLERELLDRSKRILEWTEKRVKNHLSDRIDQLQTRSAYQMRLMSLKAAEQELTSAKITFNQMRNLPADETTLAGTEEPELIPTERVLNLSVPVRATETLDVKAAKESERVTKASNELSLQKVQPDLSLFASAGFNGIDFAGQQGALTRALTAQHPIYTAGVKLNFALDLSDTADIRAGRAKQQMAAEHLTRQKELESESTFRDLSQKFNEARLRLKMADELVSMQKEKLEYEKYRFNLGRTTTYQVLTFEQDYAQAVISRLRIENEILALHSQLKTFAQD